jgi:hypothetical protein
MALTLKKMCFVIPAKAGLQVQNGAAEGRNLIKVWMPAFAGMTEKFVL